MAAALVLGATTAGAQFLAEFDRLVVSQCTPDEAILIAQHVPGLYRIFERESPLWEIYFLCPASPERQTELIAQLEAKNVNWAVAGNLALDGQESLWFQNTHRLVWDYLMARFDPLSALPPPAHYRALHRRNAERSGAPSPETAKVSDSR